MELISASEANENDLRYTVRFISKVKIYYVWTGRNAWWGTRSNQYSKGCMHATFESAKLFCEKRRSQGTVFNIDELPSLAFHALESALIVSEINTDRLFGRFDLNKLSSLIDILPVSTLTLNQLVCIFNSTSPLWPMNYPKKDSCLISFAAGNDNLSEIVTSQELISYRSSSAGGGVALRWTPRPLKKDLTLIQQLSSLMGAKVNQKKVYSAGSTVRVLRKIEK